MKKTLFKVENLHGLYNISNCVIYCNSLVKEEILKYHPILIFGMGWLK